MNNLEGNISSPQNLDGNVSMQIGLTPDIQIGETITLDGESDAYVKLAEGSTKAKPIFNFGIPKGIDGVDGADGKDGEDYTITDSDYAAIANRVLDNVNPVLENNLEQSKAYADSIKPTKTSELTNDSKFAVTDQNNNFSTSQTVNGTLTVNGNIVQNGESYETHAEQVLTKNDEIVTRDGAVGGLSEGSYAGIVAKMYDGANDGRLGFNAAGEARVGDVGDEQPLLTRDEIANLKEGQVLVWDGTKLRAVGSSDFVKNTDYATNEKGGVVKIGSVSTGVKLDDDGLLLISRATETDIDNKQSANKPIVPANLDYAVGSVKASETQFGTIKAWMSENEDGEIGLNISTEV